MLRTFSLACGAIVAFAALSGHVAVGEEKKNASKEAEIQPDLSSAKSATLAWLDASWSGNASAVHKILVDDAKQREFVAPMLRLNAAFRTLESVAIERYGDAGKKVTGYPDGSAKAFAKKITIKEQGDRATVSIKEAIFPLELRKIDGQWRVDLSEFTRDKRAQELFKESDAFAKLAEDFALDIKKGKYKTAEAAAAAFLEKRLALPEVKASSDDSDPPQ